MTKPNKIRIYKNFVSLEEVSSLFEVFSTHKEKFIPYSNSETGSNILTFGQDNFQSAPCFDSPNSVSDLVPEKLELIKKYYKRLEDLAKIDSGEDLSLSVLWFMEMYRGGLSPHQDNVDETIYRYDHVSILYLNDSVEGGEIVFPDYDYKFRPTAGSLVSYPADYVHSVTPVTGPRYAMPSWFTLDKKYQLKNYL